MERGIVKNFRLTDERTGETYEVGVISRKGKGRKNWMRLMLEPMKALALLEPPLRGETCRVLFYLLGIMRWGNEVPGLEMVAKALKMKAPSVARAYRQLREAGILMKTERTYNLNPMVGWKGTDREYRAACERLVGGARGGEATWDRDKAMKDVDPRRFIDLRILRRALQPGPLSADELARQLHWSLTQTHMVLEELRCRKLSDGLWELTEESVLVRC